MAPTRRPAITAGAVMLLALSPVAHTASITTQTACAKALAAADTAQHG